jgi:tRNA U38,U39,U40 pseudouridine synthase TruA
MTAGFHAKATGLGDFAVLTITGRSFLYHQILKMMGLVLAVAGIPSNTPIGQSLPL